MWFVYLLKSSKDKKYYLGQTDDIKKRPKEHNKDKVKSTKNKIPFDLIAYKEYPTQNNARWREYNLKKSTWQRKKFIRKFIGIIIFIFLFFPLIGLASVTDGTIDSTYKYAWGENIGWINFGTTEGNVHITDSALTGYAWAENIGWISLNCSNDNSCSTVDYKVSNDGEGNLSGYAWSENTGWINFNPTYGGVTIDSSGNFSGYAWGENIGWIVFNCATTNSCGTVNYKVKTDWRPQSARPACNNSTDDDNDGKTDYPDDPGCDSLTDDDETDTIGGGGGMPPVWFMAPKAPEGGFRVLINNDTEYTDKLIVNLSLFGGSNTDRMAISNNPEFSGAGSTGQIAYQSSYKWDLCQGKTNCPEGKYTVYVKFYAPWGKSSGVVSDSIIYQKEIATPKKSKKEKLIVFEGIPSGFTFKKNLSYGDRNEDVKYLQIILKKEIGPPTYPERIPATGWFGPLTKKAVIAFQEKYAKDILTPWKLTKGNRFCRQNYSR